MLSKKMRNILFGFILLLSLQATGQSCEDLRYIDPLFDVNTTFNIEYQEARPYGSLFNQPYRLNIYEPEGDTLSHRPLMIFQFGGGYLVGDRVLPPAPALCNYWAERGYVAASIDYRLGLSAVNQGSAERAVYRGVQDLQAALRFLCEFSETYGIDTNNIIVSGNSAGAFTTLHSTFMEQSQAPSSYTGFGIGLDSYSLGGLYDSGNSYWGNREVKVHGIIANWGAILDTSLIGDSSDDWVPSILFHGSADNAVPYVYGQPFSSPFFPNVYGSVPMNQRLDNTSIPHKFVPLIGAGHEPELLNDAYLDTILWESQDFMYEYVLKPEIQAVSGNLAPQVNSTESYTVYANDTIIQVCATANNGSVVSSNLNQFEVLWTTLGYDTIQVIAANSIMAYDTVYIPVEIELAIGVESFDIPISANIYPNPFSDQTTIQLNGEIEKGSALILSDMLGRRIYSAPITSNSIIINSRETGKGYFLVYLENEAGNKAFLGKLLAQ